QGGTGAGIRLNVGTVLGMDSPEFTNWFSMTERQKIESIRAMGVKTLDVGRSVAQGIKPLSAILAIAPLNPNADRIQEIKGVLGVEWARRYSKSDDQKEKDTIFWAADVTR